MTSTLQAAGIRRPTRVFHAGAGSHFIVDGEQVYADHDRDGRIARGDQYQGPLREALVGAARHFAEYYMAAFPGAKSLDPQITSGGCLNQRETASFATDPKGIVAKRPDLLGHLDFFDRRDHDGMITVGENYRSWRDLGFAPLKSLILTIGSAAVFGRLSDAFAIDVERISEKRPRGSTGIYGSDGNVDQARLAEFAATFDEGSPPGVLTHEELKAALARRARLGRIPKRQFESLFALTLRINGSRIVTKQQFIGLFDNSLFWAAASTADASGKRRL